MKIGQGNAQAHRAAAAPPPPPPPAVIEETEAPPPPSPATGKQSKLIDKLASGHFNDVAAIRLRINHADAIAASGIDVPEPDLTTEGKSQGFANAVAAYQAAFPPVEEPADDLVIDGGDLLDDVVADVVTDGVEQPVVDPGLDPVILESVVDTETLTDLLLEDLADTSVEDEAAAA